MNISASNIGTPLHQGRSTISECPLQSMWLEPSCGCEWPLSAHHVGFAACANVD
jgi:hypothetical protein